jgi:antitoxin ParD1/3/4
MKINVTPPYDDFIQQKFKSGQYASASEVVCEALLLLAQQERLSSAQLAQLREDVEAGLASGVGNGMESRRH